jgi:hypothetical protein
MEVILVSTKPWTRLDSVITGYKRGVALRSVDNNVKPVHQAEVSELQEPGLIHLCNIKVPFERFTVDIAAPPDNTRRS